MKKEERKEKDLEGGEKRKRARAGGRGRNVVKAKRGWRCINGKENETARDRGEGKGEGWANGI